MSAPFIVRSVSSIHPGKADAYQPVVADFCKLVEEREPRLLGFAVANSTVAFTPDRFGG